MELFDPTEHPRAGGKFTNKSKISYDAKRKHATVPHIKARGRFTVQGGSTIQTGDYKARDDAK